MDPLPVSILLLARDEAARFDGLLPGLGFARERVAGMDAATRDAAREVAARHGARVSERALAHARAHAIGLVLRPPLRFVRRYVRQAGCPESAHGAARCALAAALAFLEHAAPGAGPRSVGGGAEGGTRERI